MIYTDKPRHLRSHTISSQRDRFRRHRLQTPVIAERPQLDICQEFQEGTPTQPGSDSKSIATSASGERDSFDAKRRRLLQQKNWLGIDISAPINVPPIPVAILRYRYTIFELPRNRGGVQMVRS